jgi:ATP-dependent Lhr-like helicase
VADPLGDVLSRYARTHGPFRLDDVAARFGLAVGMVRMVLERLAERGSVVEGDFLPGGRSREWCDTNVLRSIKRRSLAKLRSEVEPVEPRVFGRFLAEWQGITRPRAGPDALLATVELLQGAPIPASVLETEVLPARVAGYREGDLDALCAAGDVAWRGVESLGPSDGRIALVLAAGALVAEPAAALAAGPLAATIRELLASRGALFFSDLVAATGAFAGDLVTALWDLVWSGEVTNDTLAPLRSLRRAGSAREARRVRAVSTLSRRPGPPGSEGRWSLVARPGASPASTDTQRRAALAAVLLGRHGVLTREAVASEGIAGGFSSVYPVLKAMEEAGRARRGYFVAGLGATQFALPGADDRLRALRLDPEESVTTILAATDPANPYGAALPWPASGARPQRAAGAQVVLRDGALVAWIGRAETNLLTFLPAEEPGREAAARDLARALARLVESGRRRAVLIARIDGAEPAQSPLAPHLAAAGFTLGSRGYLKRRTLPRDSPA